ncbi:hypothetical protein ABBQ38_008331 [Trebouxia sp. C0009 RCD-2024]
MFGIKAPESYQQVNAGFSTGRREPCFTQAHPSFLLDALKDTLNDCPKAQSGNRCPSPPQTSPGIVIPFSMAAISTEHTRAHLRTPAAQQAEYREDRQHAGPLF